MKRTKFIIPFFIGMLLFGATVNLNKIPYAHYFGVFEAWATATATPTATPTPAVNTYISTQYNVSRFGYVSGDSQNAPYGGRVVYLHNSSATLSIAQGVLVSAGTTADTVTLAVQGTAAHVIGAVVGTRVGEQDIIGKGAKCLPSLAADPSSGICIVQIDGIVPLVGDGSTITSGDAVIPSTATLGGVEDGEAAGTVEAETIGVALTTSSTAGAEVDVLLETARNF
jgi:hypothetical protein